MNADRTQHVLDAIDGALVDWTVSADAMRWTPEPVPAETAPPRQQGWDWAMRQQWAGQFHDEIRSLWGVLRRANGHGPVARKIHLAAAGQPPQEDTEQGYRR